MDLSILLLFISWIVIGLLVGAGIGKVHRTLYGLGPFINSLLGVLGAFLGVIVFTLLLQWDRPVSNPGPETLLAAIIGALITVLLGQFLRGLQYRS